MKKIATPYLNKFKNLKKLTIAVLAGGLLCLTQSCRQTAASSQEDAKRGTPILVKDTVEYDKENGTFRLKVHADSIAGAKVTFLLIDGDMVLMESNDGRFSGIEPFEEGYNVQARVEWEDTAIVTPMMHLTGFVYREPVEKMPMEELQKLINQRDKSISVGTNNHFMQGFTLQVSGSQYKVESISDVFMLLKSGIWKSVTVTDVTYDDNNLITAIVLKPIGEQQEPKPKPGEHDDDFEEVEYY